MATVGSRELRNDTTGLLRRVAAGEELTVAVRGREVARLIPAPRAERGWLGRRELAKRLQTAQADPGLRDDLRVVAGDTTDDLPPLG
jgi:prevent-host-death family protein